MKLEKYYTIEEYLNFERKSEIRYEYHDGRIVPVFREGLGENNLRENHFRHNQVIYNTSTIFNIMLEDKDCIIYGSLKVGIDNNRKLCPDLVLVCGNLEMYKNTVDTIANPSLIIEVLSPSTERYDRTGKFKLYRQLPSFKEYMLISTDVPTVETFYRETADYWHIGTAIGLDWIVIYI